MLMNLLPFPKKPKTLDELVDAALTAPKTQASAERDKFEGIVKVMIAKGYDPEGFKRWLEEQDFRSDDLLTMFCKKWSAIREA